MPSTIVMMPIKEENKTNEIPCNVKMNEYTDCQTFTHHGHTVYYCHVLTPSEFYESKKAKENDDTFFYGALICLFIVPIIATLLVIRWLNAP